MFDQLSERLTGVFSTLGGQKSLTPDNMEDALREIRRALLEADVSLRAIKNFLSRVRDRADGQAVLKAVDPGQQLVKVVHDELIQLLGGEHQGLSLTGDPTILMLFGLQGSGKTTTAGKLARMLQQQQHKPLLIAADVYRPAAIHQLQVLGEQLKVPVHTVEGSTDVQAIVRTGLDRASTDGHDTVIVDTAGRLQIDTDLMAELLLLERAFKPHEKLLVIDAMMGQEAVNVAETFNTQLGVTGIVLTKADSDARGGAALSVAEMTGQPIKYLGVGESLEGLEPFYPERLASRILGMGDVVSLVEKAQQAMDIKEAEKLEEKVRKQSLSFDDFRKMQQQFSMLGSLDQVLGMLPIPGLNKENRQMLAHGGEAQMKRMDAMINSMTPAERQEPDLLQTPGRVRRLARGCGMAETDVQQFLTQFNQMQMMMKQMTQMGDKVKKEQAPRRAFGLPRRRKAKKGTQKGGGGPALPGGFPSGFPPGLPPGGSSGGFPFQ